MDATWKTMIWRQFGAAIQMIENAIEACPDDLWGDRTRNPQFWYMVCHALFYLDLYLSESLDGFAPPPPFTRAEMDPDAPLPEQAYSKSQARAYLEHGRKKCKTTIEAFTEERARRRCGFYWLEMTDAELLLYNMRHVQHHAAQLNLILRQTIDSAPGWVALAKST